jgi:hypothetical protein
MDRILVGDTPSLLMTVAYLTGGSATIFVALQLLYYSRSLSNSESRSMFCDAGSETMERLLKCKERF